MKFDATYILPIKLNEAPQDGDLRDYLAWLAQRLEVIVVDGSLPAVFVENDVQWRGVQHIQPAPKHECENGKVWGVLTGLELAMHERIIIGDDDVRYDNQSLEATMSLLDRYDVVRPQNYFDPMPWHSLWDTGRTLLNRVSGGDWPGTIGVRRSILRRTNGYRGDCLFENLELIRTVKAAGGSEHVALNVFVRRRPPTASHFWSQRVRQAYDEFARPLRLAFQLTWLPVQLALAVRSPKSLIALHVIVVGLAEAGRRRGNGASVFPFAASLMTPLWVVERSVCAWLAVFSRGFQGGVTYRGGVLARAASSPAELRQRRLKEEATT
jgi:hypothetical protein